MNVDPTHLSEERTKENAQLQMERITSSVTMTQRSQLMTLYGMKDHHNPIFSLALDPFRLVEITRLPLFP